MGTISCDSHNHRVVLFPFMSKGHTIPLLHLARLLLSRCIAVTFFTTPANRPFIATSLSDTAASICDLPFPHNIPEIPSGVESTDRLPSISLFPSFALSTQLMQPHFEQALKILPRVSFMVSDAFIWWTQESADKFGIPRLVFYGMSNYSMCVYRAVAESRVLLGANICSDDELITLPQFPWIKVTENDFDPSFSDPDLKGPPFEFMTKLVVAASMCHGYVVNSFYELEPVFVDYWNNNYKPPSKAWCVGPLCLAEPLQPPRVETKPTWIQWLDEKLDQGKSVLYIAFGSQAEISLEQLKEIAQGLEESGVNFLWVIKKRESELLIGDGSSFEERVKERGVVVREWVDQREILMHKGVQGFLRQCGWNSILESISAGVPILAWPMMAEQPLNAKMVVEEIKVGLRVETCDGSVRGFVKWEGLKKVVRELMMMEGEMVKVVRKNVKEYAELAMKAMGEGSGSSWLTLNMLIDEICNARKT